MAELVNKSSQIGKIFIVDGFESRPSQTKDLQTTTKEDICHYLSITRTDLLSIRTMWLTIISNHDTSGGLTVGQHYKATISAHFTSQYGTRPYLLART